jgi:signal transduction histidine kinase
MIVMKNFITTYALSVLSVLGAFVIQWYLGIILGKEAYFLLFLPAIALTAWYGGFRPGFAATAFASLLISFFFLPYNGVFTPALIASLIQLCFFIAEGLVVSYTIEYLKKHDAISKFKEREKAQTQLFEDLQKKYVIAQEEIKARDEFLSIASHELKTPLTSMLLQLQAALHNIRNVSLANFSVEKLLKMLESTQQQTNRLSKMINDLLNVSLITTKKLDLEFEEVDLAQVTKEVAESFSEKLQREGYTLYLDNPKAVVGHWDKVRIEQAITNLISNAIKYGDKKPIEIRVANSDGTGKIFVRDQGIGIPYEQREKIFALFERAAPASKYQGLGVGLYITNQIVKAHNGKIKVESREQEGSTFMIELPLNPSQIKN